MNFKVLKNAAFQWSMRIFMPGLAKQMQQEGTFELKEGKEIAEEDYMLVEDRGADVTIYAFSGIDVLFAGMGRFEFRKLLENIGQEYNLVFMRDLQRFAYQVAPDGSLNGREFHTNAILDVKKRLGSRINIALGSSSGGQSAFYFASVCGMDGVIAFGPAFPYTVYTRYRYLLQAILDIKHLLWEPSGYFEVILVCIGARYQRNKIAKMVPPGWKPWDVLETYLAASPRPRATVFYGRYAPPDARQAKLIESIPEVKLIALDTGRHNSPAYLKSKGILGEYVSREIREMVEAAQAKRDATT